MYTHLKCLSCGAILTFDRKRCVCGEGDLYVLDPVLATYHLYQSAPPMEEAIETKEVKRRGEKAEGNTKVSPTDEMAGRRVKRRYKARSHPRATGVSHTDRSPATGQPRKRGRPLGSKNKPKKV